MCPQDGNGWSCDGAGVAFMAGRASMAAHAAATLILVPAGAGAKKVKERIVGQDRRNALVCFELVGDLQIGQCFHRGQGRCGCRLKGEAAGFSEATAHRVREVRIPLNMEGVQMFPEHCLQCCFIYRINTFRMII